MKLKLKAVRDQMVDRIIHDALDPAKPARAATKPAKAPRAGKAPKAAPGDENARLSAQEAAAAKIAAKERNARAGADVELERAIRAYFGQRHVEWLERVARQERRTLAQMLDRIVRLAWAQDPTKGGIHQANKGGGTGEGGVTGIHPAAGGE